MLNNFKDSTEKRFSILHFLTVNEIYGDFFSLKCITCSAKIFFFHISHVCYNTMHIIIVFQRRENNFTGSSRLHNVFDTRIAAKGTRYK